MITPPSPKFGETYPTKLPKGSIQERLIALQGTISNETLQENATKLAKEWFNRALDNG